MKPLVKYYGGKQRIASRIVRIIERIPHRIYVEPFAGGCAVLFAKGKPIVTNHHHYRECVNDSDERIVTMYRVARDRPDDLRRWLELTPYSQSELAMAYGILRDPDGHSELRRAWAAVVSLRMGFSAQFQCGWGMAKTGANHASKWSNYLDALPGILDRLRGVHVGCEDAIRCIDRWDHPDTLFYCDPPYPGTNQGHYGGYSLDDWSALCRKLEGIRGSYVLSGYSQDVEPEHDERIEIRARATVIKPENGKRKNDERIEVLWARRRKP